MNNTVLCMDIGGTFIKCGLINQRGEIQNKINTPTPSSYDDFLTSIASLWYTHGKTASGMAIALPGGYDFMKKQVFAPNLTIINGKNIKDDIENIIGTRVMLENDGNLAALGEYVFAEKKNMQDMAFITLGTGVGGGIIIGGKLMSKDVTAFEIGHVSLDINGLMCGCGRRGCLERYCSVAGLQLIFEEITGNKNIEPKYIGQLASENNKEALITMEKYGALLAQALLNVANIFLPEKIKIGGGLSELSDYFLPSCVNVFERDIFPLYRGRVKIEKATLRNDAGMLGAAALFFNI